MKFKGYIPEGWELIKGKYGKHLRRIRGSLTPIKLNSVFEKNTEELPRVSQLSSLIKKALMPDKMDMYASDLYVRLNSFLMYAQNNGIDCWQKDLFKNFEMHERWKAGNVFWTNPEYSLKDGICMVSMPYLSSLINDRTVGIDDTRVKLVLVFIDEAKKSFKRTESPETIIKGRDFRKDEEMSFSFEDCEGLPYLLFMYGTGYTDNEPTTRVKKRGMVVIGSGRV